MFYEKTKVLAKIAIINTLLHLFLAIPLVYFYGAIGGAVVNCLSWGGMLFMVYYWGSKNCLFPWSGRVKLIARNY